MPVESIQGLIPEPLQVDQINGMAWLSVASFRMTGVTRRGLPTVPGLSAFPELNLRTYVTDGKKPGVWFLSLEATSRLAVWAARRWFHLPYHLANIEVESERDEVHYRCQRRNMPVPISFEATYRPTSPPYLAKRDTLEHWLTERYCLYASSSKGNLYRVEVHHVPWPLQQAEATIACNNLGKPFNLVMEDAPSLLHFSRRIDTVVWSPMSV